MQPQLLIQVPSALETLAPAPLVKLLNPNSNKPAYLVIHNLLHRVRSVHLVREMIYRSFRCLIHFQEIPNLNRLSLGPQPRPNQQTLERVLAFLVIRINLASKPSHQPNRPRSLEVAVVVFSVTLARTNNNRVVPSQQLRVSEGHPKYNHQF